MVARLTVDQFFDALCDHRAYPLIDTPRVRDIVGKNVRALCADYPIKDRWPLLDLESAYVAYLNAQPDIVVWHRNGYIGTIRIRNFDETYTLDEWFGDFTRQWNLKDTDGIRAAMLALLPPGRAWRSPVIFAAHKKAVESTTSKLARWLSRT